MKHRHTACAVIFALLGCEPTDDDTSSEPGNLEYESSLLEIYRRDNRIDVIPTDPNGERRCGILTARALRDIQDTIDALDPSADYDFETGDEECSWSESPAAQIHLEGFEQSPFSCDELCCRPDLGMVASVYFLALNNLDGMIFDLDGEPYVAIDPEMSCP